VLRFDPIDPSAEDVVDVDLHIGRTFQREANDRLTIEGIGIVLMQRKRLRHDARRRSKDPCGEVLHE
jgi:hypothetical protein